MNPLNLSGLDFFAALREVERRLPNRAAVGEDATPSSEAVRFRSDTGMTDLGGEVAAVEPPAAGRPAEVFLRWLSLFGANGTLPHEITDLVNRAGKEGEPLHEFADAFLHRPLSLAYAASERLRPGAAYERRGGAAGWSKDDPYLAAALKAAGLFHLPDELADRLAGVLAPLARYAGTPAALAAAASAHLGVPVRVLPRIHRPPVESDGRPTSTRPRFTVRVGPLGWAEYQRLLPPEPGCEPPAPLFDLLGLTRLFAGVRRFDVELLLRSGERLPAGERGRRWLTTLPIDREDAPRIGRIPSSLCEHLLGDPPPVSTPANERRITEQAEGLGVFSPGQRPGNMRPTTPQAESLRDPVPPLRGGG